MSYVVCIGLRRRNLLLQARQQRRSLLALIRPEAGRVAAYCTVPTHHDFWMDEWMDRRMDGRMGCSIDRSWTCGQAEMG